MNFNYSKLTPFKWYVLENFPFIEADFDALTEWQLFCKLGQEMNKIIDSQNNVGTQAENLTNAFNQLYDYVNNYFNNLDVQNEINTKLNEMAQDGTLNNIINQEIFGQINSDINNLKTDVTNIENNINSKKFIFDSSGDTIIYGDSYGGGYNAGGLENAWTTKLKNKLGLTDDNCTIINKGGAGFVGNTQGFTFLSYLQSIINTFTNKNNVKNFILCGGYNDANKSGIENAMNEFINYVKSQFPNTNIFIGFIGYNSRPSSSQTRLYLNSAKNTYINANTDKPYIYLNNVEFILQDSTLMSDDFLHPNENGQNALAKGIFNSLINGTCSISRFTSDLPTYDSIGNNGQLADGMTCFQSQINNIKSVGLLGITINYDTPFNITGGSSATIFENINFRFIKCNNYPIYLQGFCSIKTQDGNFDTYECMLALTLSGKLSLQPIKAQNGGVFKTFTDVTQIRINVKTSTFDSNFA